MSKKLSLSILALVMVVLLMCSMALVGCNSANQLTEDEMSYVTMLGSIYCSMVYPCDIGYIQWSGSNTNRVFWQATSYGSLPSIDYSVKWDSSPKFSWEDGVMIYDDTYTELLVEDTLKDYVITESTYLDGETSIDWNSSSGYYQAFFATDGMTYDEVSAIISSCGTYIAALAYRSTDSGDGVALHMSVGSYANGLDIDERAVTIECALAEYKDAWVNSELFDIEGLDLYEQVNFLLNNQTNADDILIGVSIVGDASLVQSVAEHMDLVFLSDRVR